MAARILQPTISSPSSSPLHQKQSRFLSLNFACCKQDLLLSRANLSAIQQPGRAEEYLRSKITRAVIRRRDAREEIPVGPADPIWKAWALLPRLIPPILPTSFGPYQPARASRRI